MRDVILIDLGSAVARVHADAGRPHLEWVQLFTPTGEHLVLQQKEALALARVILEHLHEPTPA